MKKLGNHTLEVNGVVGVYFSVWAPAAKKVAVVGNFNQWNDTSHELLARQDQSGIWEGFIPGLAKGEIYKYNIISWEWTLPDER